MSTQYHSADAVALDIVARLQRMTVAQGAETDAGRVVYRGKRTVSADLVPCTTLIEGDDIPDRQNIGNTYKVDQRFAVIAYVPCDEDDPNVAGHAAVRDIKRAIFNTNGQADWRLGGRVVTVDYLGRQFAARAPGEKFLPVVVELSVVFVENVAQP